MLSFSELPYLKEKTNNHKDRSVAVCGCHRGLSGERVEKAARAVVRGGALKGVNTLEGVEET